MSRRVEFDRFDHGDLWSDSELVGELVNWLTHGVVVRTCDNQYRFYPWHTIDFIHEPPPPEDDPTINTGTT